MLTKNTIAEINQTKSLFDWSPETLNVVNTYEDIIKNDRGKEMVFMDALNRLNQVFAPFVCHPLFSKGNILDIGSGIGLFSCIMATIYPDRKVTAFEPDKELLKIHEKAVKILKLENITLKNAAILENSDLSVSLKIHEDGIFRTLEKSTVNDISIIPFKHIEDRGINSHKISNYSLVKLTAPGNFFKIANYISSKTDVLLGEIWKCDYPCTLQNGLFEIMESNISMISIRDAESQLVYKTNATQRSSRFSTCTHNTYVKKSEKIVSAIIPTYNIGNLIEECVESILKFKHSGLEVLVINDGSTDSKTISALKNISKINGVKVLNKVNGGCASARNYGIKRATGKYLALIDGDDFVTDDFFPLLLDGINVNATNICEIGFADYIDQSGTSSDNIEPYTSNHKLHGIEGNMWELLRRQPAIWRRLYRREWLLEKKLFFPEYIKAYDDLEFQFKTLYLNKGITYVNQRGYFYRKDRPGQDIKASDTRHFGTFQMLMRLELFLREQHATRDMIILYDLFTLDCFCWSYDLLNPELKPIFLKSAISFLYAGKSIQRVKNINWEISNKIYNSFCFDFNVLISSDDEAIKRSLALPQFKDHVYDYMYAMELNIKN